MKKHKSLEHLDQDIRDHIERETEDNIARGMTPEDARSAALRKFGNVTLVKEDTRRVWNPVWVEQLFQDLRYCFLLQIFGGFFHVSFDMRFSPSMVNKEMEGEVGPGDVWSPEIGRAHV